MTWELGSLVKVVVVPPVAGAWLTVRVTGMLVTEPEALEITTVYEPAMSGWTSVIRSSPLVAPVMLSPLNCHW